MNKKGVGILVIIFGCYLLVGNTIFSFLFNYAGPIGFDVPISPINYWLNWWSVYGFVTVIVAVAGLLLMIQGIRILIRINRSTLVIRESY